MAVSLPVSHVTVQANDDEGERNAIIDNDILNKTDSNNNERYDRSILNDIDPDVNFLHDGLKSFITVQIHLTLSGPGGGIYAPSRFFTLVI